MDESVPDAHREEVNFFVAGFVCLSLIINGPSTRWLYMKLELYPVQPYREFVFSRAMQGLDAIECPAHETQLKLDPFHAKSDWNLVRLFLPDFKRVRLLNGSLDMPAQQSVKQIFQAHVANNGISQRALQGSRMLSQDYMVAILLVRIYIGLILSFVFVFSGGSDAIDEA
jgi:hypothetical protein